MKCGREGGEGSAAIEPAGRRRPGKIGLKGHPHVTESEIIHRKLLEHIPIDAAAQLELLCCYTVAEAFETTPARPKYTLHRPPKHTMHVCAEAFLKRRDVVYTPP